MIELAPSPWTVARLGIRAELMLQTEGTLKWVRRALADMAYDDPDRVALAGRADALVQLLEDLEQRLPSAAVLEAAVRLRA